MSYDVKCTHCISLLKNYSKLKNSYFFMKNGEMYIEVSDEQDKKFIELIEMHLDNAYWYYNKLIERA